MVFHAFYEISLQCPLRRLSERTSSTSPSHLTLSGADMKSSSLGLGELVRILDGFIEACDPQSPLQLQQVVLELFETLNPKPSTQMREKLNSNSHGARPVH